MFRLINLNPMERIIILDFGSQVTQVIGRRVRELDVYCEIYPFNKFPFADPVKKTIPEDVKGLILSGSPFSVRDENSPKLDLGDFAGKLPILGICYGAQYIAHTCGGAVEASNTREYGRAELTVADESEPIFKDVPKTSQVWMSHGDSITKLPDGTELIASTPDVRNAAYKIPSKNIYAFQYHPEVFHTQYGGIMLRNFVKGVCLCKGDWTTESFIEATVKDLKAKLGDDEVILGLSGGVDSSVAAVLLNKAIGSRLHCIFVDNGLLRKNEFEDVLEQYKDMGLNVIGVRAADRFLEALKGISEPEGKRKAIGKTFIDVFDSEAQKIKNAKWLAQGTIYPDVIESSSVKGPSATIKSHHNVGGLPEKMGLKLCEPLKWLFKDEVRRVGYQLQMPERLIKRHPFPGPGLAVRILGDITREKVRILQDADDIYIEKMHDYKMSDGTSLYDHVWQAGTVLLSTIRSVGVMGDERTYEHPVALRAVTSMDAMTADWARLPYDFMADVSNEIIRKVKGVNRVCYDISSKPPSTIEWE